VRDLATKPPRHLIDHVGAVQEYVETRPALLTPAGADNQCRIAVQGALMDRPTSDGPWVPDAREVWLIGHRNPVPRNPAMSPGRTEAEHAVLCVADQMLCRPHPSPIRPDGSPPSVLSGYRSGRRRLALVCQREPPGRTAATPSKARLVPTGRSPSLTAPTKAVAVFKAS
jgi:hypothetical protein